MNLSTLYWAFFWQNIRILFPLSWHTHSTQTEIIWFPSLSKWISVYIGYTSASNVGYMVSAWVSEMSDILKKKKRTERWVFIYVEILEEIFSKKRSNKPPPILRENFCFKVRDAHGKTGLRVFFSTFFHFFSKKSRVTHIWGWYRDFKHGF